MMTLEQKKDAAYRKVEALYRKGFGTREISKAVGLSATDTLDIMQKIFALDQNKIKWG